MFYRHLFAKKYWIEKPTGTWVRKTMSSIDWIFSLSLYVRFLREFRLSFDLSSFIIIFFVLSFAWNVVEVREWAMTMNYMPFEYISRWMKIVSLQCYCIVELTCRTLLSLSFISIHNYIFVKRVPLYLW